MARYELILRLDGALWLMIIFEPPLTPIRAMEGPKICKKVKNYSTVGQLTMAEPSPRPPATYPNTQPVQVTAGTQTQSKTTAALAHATKMRCGIVVNTYFPTSGG